MEYFIAQAKIVLPVVGVNVLRAASSRAESPAALVDSTGTTTAVSPVFEMRIQRYRIEALAQEIDGEFTVLEGSMARTEWIGATQGYESLRHKLIQDQTLVASQDGRALVFGHNQVFASPSAAAAVIAGRASNGRTEWKIQGDITTYGNWENRGIETAMSSGEPS